MADAKREIDAGDRFAFGENWARFLADVDDERIEASTEALRTMLGRDDLAGCRFLDVGSGSGLSSLAAHRLGATVVSFDFDPDSVATTTALRDRYAAGADWTVQQGSVLDRDYLATLGTFDVVYSWGVLHHTGQMWEALENVAMLVAPGGLLFLAIYNDQGARTVAWRAVKRRYNDAGPVGRRAIVAGVGARFAAQRGAVKTVKRLVGRNSADSDADAGDARGMSRRHDLVDWVGGWPFEVAKPEQIFEFYRARGYTLERLTTCAGSHGCNEFVLRAGTRP